MLHTRWSPPRLAITIRRVCILGILAAACCFGQRTPTAQSYKFNPVTITAGGFLTGFVTHPTAPGLMYVRTDMGGAYRWDATNKIWIPLVDFESAANYNLTGVESIALDPTDPNRLYLAVGTYYTNGSPVAMLVSTNQGATFTTYSTASYFMMGGNEMGRNLGERLAVNPFKPNELFMGTRQKGLWVSEDHAQTWTQSASFPIRTSSDNIGIGFVVFDPVNQGTIYVGANAQNGLYRSTDGGVTWSPIAGQMSTFPTGNKAAAKPMCGRLAPDGNLYVTYGDGPGPYGVANGAVMKYNPTTAIWSNITPPYDTAQGEVPPDGGFSGLAVDVNHPGTIAVVTLDRSTIVDTIYVTHDGGSTWVNLGLLTTLACCGTGAGGNYSIPMTQVVVPGSPSTPNGAPVPIPWLSFGWAPDESGYGAPSAIPGTAKFGWWQAAVAYDPFNSNHLMYGTGATIYATDNVSAADSGQAPTWYVQGWGIEQTAALAFISPTVGAHLLSGVGDIGGFKHDDFTMSPAGGTFTNPVFITTNSLDWAGQNPSYIVRSGVNYAPPCALGAYSTDGGNTWTPMKCRSGLTTASSSGGTLAVDATGTHLMWFSSGAPQYSADNGTTWATETGGASAAAVADKVQASTFYQCSGTTFYESTDGHSFAKANTAIPTIPSCATPVVNPLVAGDIWLPLTTRGLWHSTDFGKTWAQVGGPTSSQKVTTATMVTLGLGAPSSANPAIFLFGTVSILGAQALYRSDNLGATWVRIDDDLHQYGGPTLIKADPRVYGRVYLGMNGRGIIYGDIAK